MFTTPTPTTPLDPFRLVTVRDEHLSRWQSAAVRVAREDLAARGQPLDHANVHRHELVVSVTAHISKEKDDGFWHALLEDIEHPFSAHKSKSFLEEADNAIDQFGEKTADEALESAGIRPDSNRDVLFVKTQITYIRYWFTNHGKRTYRDWTREGAHDPRFGIIEWQLPADATVAVIGDWGTGLADAVGMLTEIFEAHHPDAVVHLGDIYYSGTKEECSRHFWDIFESLFQHHKRVPVFTIPGNHDYYDFGVGFYDLLDTKLNQGEPAWQQKASYFCLRSADGRWQFLGMDTGLHDGAPLDRAKNLPTEVEANEQDWLRDKLDHFPGDTILCSHNQVFSAHAVIDSTAPDGHRNDKLLGIFTPQQLARVPVWFWGHEHTLVLYRNGLFGVHRGRLVGASAFEISHDDNPYADNSKGTVPQQLFSGDQPVDAGGQPVQVGLTDNFFNHSYAILKLAGPGTVAYYEFPSWAGTKPPLTAADRRRLVTETLH